MSTPVIEYHTMMPSHGHQPQPQQQQPQHQAAFSSQTFHNSSSSSQFIKLEEHHMLITGSSNDDHHRPSSCASVESRTSSDNGGTVGGKAGSNSRPNRDPLSHRIIEKRRRDRMNNCLTNLSKMIPGQYLKKGRGRIEKTEIIEMAIRYMHQLRASINNSTSTSGSEPTPKPCPVSPPSSKSDAGVATDLSGVEVDEMTAIVRKGHLTPTLTRLAQEHHRRGYEECAAEVYRVLTNGNMEEGAKQGIVTHLRGIYHNRSISNNNNNQPGNSRTHQQQQQQPFQRPTVTVVTATSTVNNTSSHRPPVHQINIKIAKSSTDQPLNMSMKRAKSTEEGSIVDDASIHSNSATSGGDSEHGPSGSSGVYPSSPSSDRTCISTSTVEEADVDIALFALHTSNGYYIPCTVRSNALHDTTRQALTTTLNQGERTQCHPVTIPVHFIAAHPTTANNTEINPNHSSSAPKKRPPNAHEHLDAQQQLSWVDGGLRPSMGLRTHA